MKTLQLFRALSMAGGLTCFMISCLPDIKGENGYDWMMIAFAFVGLYHLLNSFIFYNARKAYEAENLNQE